MASVCGASLFGSTSQYIKVGNGEFIAIEGANTRERLLVSDLRMPYKQLLKSRVILKPGQVNYLLNHLGLGDNATFLAIKAVYNPKSVIEEDNFVNWAFYDDLTKIYSFAQMMVLTGNSSHRIKQLYLTNPNTNYAVTLDVMIGVIDDSYNFFNDSVNQTATSFTGLEYSDIASYVVGESIVIYDKSTPVRPLIFISLVNIESIQRSEKILIIDDSSLGTIFLQFLTESDAYQAHSLLNYVLENPNVDIANISPLEDLVDPIVYFNDTAGATGSFIAFNGSTASVPYDTGDGFTFSTSISLTNFGTSSGTLLDKSHLLYLLIDYIEDNRDGYMTMLPSNLTITGTSGTISSITGVGTYSLSFDFSDIAQNYLDGVIITLDVTA
jgi:hypothetical protein